MECPKCCSAFHCKECEGGFEAAHSLQVMMLIVVVVVVVDDDDDDDDCCCCFRRC